MALPVFRAVVLEDVPEASIPSETCCSDSRSAGAEVTGGFLGLILGDGTGVGVGVGVGIGETYGAAE